MPRVRNQTQIPFIATVCVLATKEETAPLIFVSVPQQPEETDVLRRPGYEALNPIPRAHPGQSQVPPLPLLG